MGYVFAIIWVIIVIKGILQASRNSQKRGGQSSQSSQGAIITYKGRNVQLPGFVGKEGAFLQWHLKETYRAMLDFYGRSFAHGGTGDYELPLQERRVLFVGGISENKIKELRDDARTTAMVLYTDGAYDENDVASTANSSSEEKASAITVTSSEYAPSPKKSDPHAGESYASPIPPPHESPMAGAEMPSERHADSHVAPVQVKDDLPVHGASAAARHADEHIATTVAAATPETAQQRPARRSPYRSLFPRGERDLRRAMVLNEILGTPKGLR